MAIYLRDHGPICYEVPVFADPLVRKELPTQLLLSDLNWLWESGRRHDIDETHSAFDTLLPNKRFITLLTQNNVNLFLADLEERDVDGYGRWIHLFGVDQTSERAMLKPSEILSFLHEFSTNESGPIRIVIVQVSDIENEYMFMPHKPITEVVDLLKLWGTKWSLDQNRRKYKDLRSATLESTFHLFST